MDPKPEILIIDDSLADVKLAFHALNRSGALVELVVVRDGEEALEFLLQRGRYEKSVAARSMKLILLDLKLPKINGFEVLRTIKAEETTRTIPVVVLSTSHQERDLLEGYRLGANSYVQKPVDFERYQTLIESIKTYWLSINQTPRPSQSNATERSSALEMLP